MQVVTRTASLARGSNESSSDSSEEPIPDCVNRTRAAFAALWEQSATPEGQAVVSQALNLCEGALESEVGAFQGARLPMGYGVPLGAMRCIK